MPARPAVITTPPVTLDEIAKLFGISKKRQKELSQMVREVMAEMDEEDRMKRESAQKSRDRRQRNSARQKHR